MPEGYFHIEFQRSGGFTGGSTRVEVNSQELDPVLAEELGLLIDRSGFFEAVVLENRFLNMPDQFTYEITVEHMGKRRKLELTDGTMPDLFRPLVNFLVGVARKQRRMT
jgi:hypothetical protein